MDGSSRQRLKGQGLGIGVLGLRGSLSGAKLFLGECNFIVN